MDNINQNSNGLDSQGRLLYIDPNKRFNEPINQEDLTISVQLTTRRKNRTIATNSQSQEVTIRFINGSSNAQMNRVVDKNTEGFNSLTTRFTEPSSLEIMDNINSGIEDGNDDYESLGIESIDIEFNTAYVPIVKIKFIDIRGNAIFSKGNDSKYNVFFDLPYPVFNLTIKGFYGKPVTYCLHLRKWDSKFNSDTGNFEIQCDFIGYTYAFLTDMILDYVIGGVATEKGLKNLAEVKSNYLKPELIKTIDEFKTFVNELDNIINGITDIDNKPVYEEILDSVEKIEDEINSLIKSLKENDQLYTNDGPIGLNSDDNSDNIKSLFVFNKSNENIEELIKEYESKVGIELDKINSNLTGKSNLRLNGLVKTIYNNIFYVSTNLEINFTSNSYINNIFYEQQDDNNIKKELNNFLDSSNITKENLIKAQEQGINTNYRIIYLQKIIDKIKDYKSTIEESIETIESSIVDEISDKVSNELGFEPTIRNVFRILTVNIEVFMKTLKDVSEEATDNSNRDNQLKKFEDNLNINSNSDEIFPWVEYYKKDKNGDLVESWLGNDVNDINKVPELKFTEELIKRLLNINKEEFKQLGLIRNYIYPWYPISPNDTTIGGVEENPYFTKLKNNTNISTLENIISDRSNYLLFKTYINVYNDLSPNKIGMPGDNTNTPPEIVYSYFLRNYSKLEAYNIFRALVNLGENGKNLLERILGNFDITRNTSMNTNLFSEDFEIIEKNLFINEDKIEGNDPDFGQEVIKEFLKEDYYVPINEDKLIKNLNKSIFNGKYNIIEFENIDLKGSNKFKNSGEGFPKDNEVKSTLLFYNEPYNTSNNQRSKNPFLSKYNTVFKRFLSDITIEENRIIKYKKTKNNINYNANLISDIRINSEKVNNLHGLYGKHKELLSQFYDGSINEDKLFVPYLNYGVYTPNEINKEEGLANLEISLFGSKFYYLQDDIKKKAFLFLHSFPFMGVNTYGNDIKKLFLFDEPEDWDKSGKSELRNIKNMFSKFGSFIYAPKMWVLFIGATLWRYRQGKEVINFGSEPSETLIPTNSIGNPNITHKQFLYAHTNKDNRYGMFFNEKAKLISDIKNNNLERDGLENNMYKPIDKVLRGLDNDIKDKFIEYFEDWVEDENDGFGYINNQLSLVNNIDDFDNLFNNLLDKVDINNDTISISEDEIKSFNEIDSLTVNNYLYILPDTEIYNHNIDNNFKFINVMFRPNTPVMNKIVLLLTDEVIIKNPVPSNWTNKEVNPEDKNEIFNAYIEKLKTQLNELAGENLEDFDKEEPDDSENDVKRLTFGTIDDDYIKLTVYRTLSSIYNKWISGNPNEIINYCSTPNKNSIEKITANKFKRNNNIDLIDTFKFLDRSYKDIGDDFYLDIIKVKNLFNDFRNKNFFNIANTILSDNNFNFIPLPNFVNFNDKNELSDMFNTFKYNKISIGGPSFVCVYVGQGSEHLNLGKNANYKDDGIFLKEDNNGSIIIPSDFSNTNASDLDLSIPVFAINYGQQNQNYFKSISINQSEFTETAESLETISYIGDKNGENIKATSIGNSLFNIYKTRSYTATVEMMGNLQIQPMMYFQLNNIPMFRGLYLIYKVNHKVTPNHVITTFSGNRVRRIKTPLTDKSKIYMNIIGSRKGSNVISGVILGKLPPIALVLDEVGCINGRIDSFKISSINKNKLVDIPNSIRLNDGTSINIMQKGFEPSTKKFLNVGKKPLLEMLKDWTEWMIQEGWKSDTDKQYFGITSLFRKLGNTNNGNSKHGWGIAVDIQFRTKNGDIIPNSGKALTGKYLKISENPAIKWLYENAYKYGFIIPIWARDKVNVKGNPEEHWHWEYHGKAAKCIIEKTGRYEELYNQKIDMLKGDEDYKVFVKNPININNKEAEFTSDCKYTQDKQSDGIEGDTTLTAQQTAQSTIQSSINDNL